MTRAEQRLVYLDRFVEQWLGVEVVALGRVEAREREQIGRDVTVPASAYLRRERQCSPRPLDGLVEAALAGYLPCFSMWPEGERYGIDSLRRHWGWQRPRRDRR